MITSIYLLLFTNLVFLIWIIIQDNKISSLENNLNRMTEFTNNFMIPRIDENTDKLQLHDAAVNVLVGEVSLISKFKKV